MVKVMPCEYLIISSPTCCSTRDLYLPLVLKRAVALARVALRLLPRSALDLQIKFKKHHERPKGNPPQLMSCLYSPINLADFMV